MAKRRFKKKVDLMLDSGVFSAWSRGEELSIPDYANYVKRNSHLLFSYVSMDVVPRPSSKTGRPPTDDETARSAEASYTNLCKLKEHGLQPIPVFHQGEPIKWLEKMLVEGEQYIGISTWKTSIMPKAQRKWLDEVFSLLTDTKGRPLVKTHGFGITSPGFLLRYPWYTTDSTTWALAAGFGKLFIPQYRDGKPDYTKTPLNYTVSGVTQSADAANRRQFEGLPVLYQDAIYHFVTEECGLSMNAVRNVPDARRMAILRYYEKVCEAMYDTRFGYRGYTGFHNDDFHMPKDRKAMKPWNLRIMYATQLNKQHSACLNEAGAFTRLLSYYELRSKSDEVLETYIRDGTPEPYEPVPPKQDWGRETYICYRRVQLHQRMEGYRNEPQGID